MYHKAATGIIRRMVVRAKSRFRTIKPRSLVARNPLHIAVTGYIRPAVGFSTYKPSIVGGKK
jgi:hypothetical protein